MKTKVYSWRLSPERRKALQMAARREDITTAELLDRITDQWLAAEEVVRLRGVSEQARKGARARKRPS